MLPAPAPQNLPERLPKRPHRTLHLPLVRSLPRPARIHPETTHPRIRRIRPVQHRRRARSARYRRLRVVDPNPQRNAPIPLEQRVMPRVPRQLRLVLARPAELRPAIRQRPQQQRQLRPLRPDRNPILEPVVLRLDPRRRLHPTDRSQPRLPVLPPHMTHHRLVAPLIPVSPEPAPRKSDEPGMAADPPQEDARLPDAPGSPPPPPHTHPEPSPAALDHPNALPHPTASADTEPHPPSPPDPSPASATTPPAHASCPPPVPRPLSTSCARPPAHEWCPPSASLPVLAPITLRKSRCLPTATLRLSPTACRAAGRRERNLAEANRAAGRGERNLAAAVRAARRAGDTLGPGLRDARRDVARVLEVMRQCGPERDHGPSR